MRWKDIDFDNKIIRISKTRTRSITDVEKRTKNDKVKEFPLLSFVEKILLEYKKTIANFKTNYVCVNSKGKEISPDYLSKGFRRLLDKYSLKPIRLHDLRHSNATYLINAGVNVKDVQDWLDHANYSTTANIYIHTNMQNKLRVAKVIENLFHF